MIMIRIQPPDPILKSRQFLEIDGSFVRVLNVDNEASWPKSDGGFPGCTWAGLTGCGSGYILVGRPRTQAGHVAGAKEGEREVGKDEGVVGLNEELDRALAVVTPRDQKLYARVAYSHEALINQIIANPTATNRQLGAVFGRTEGWVSLVRNSDLFLEKLAQRHNELTDPVVTAGLDERLSMLTNRSLEVLMDKMAQPSEKIPDNLAIAAATFGAKARGIGGFGRGSSDAPAPSEGRIERLAQRLEALGGHPRPVDPTIIDVETREKAA